LANLLDPLGPTKCGGFGEDKKEAVVGEGIVAEIGEMGRAEVEEFEREVGGVEGFEDQ